MSEYTKNEVSCVMQHFAAILEVPVGSLQMLMVAAVTEVLGDWQAEWSSSCFPSTSPASTASRLKPTGTVPDKASVSLTASSSCLRVTAARLEMWMCSMFEDLSTSSDLYFTEAMVHCLWMAVQQHPSMACRRVEMLVGCPRTSVESIVIALTLQTFLETRRSSALFSGMTMDELLGVSVLDETHGGSLVEYVESLLEGGVS
jgi:hypothetical protein